MNDRPVGPVVDSTPAERPGPVTLTGRFCRVEKLDAARHTDSLWRELKGHDEVWDYLAVGPFRDGKDFAEWIEERAVALDPYAYAVVDFASGRALGIVTLMEIRPAMRVIEMGSIVYSPALQRTSAATEAQYLMAKYVFETLGYRRYEWKCNDLNVPSKNAAERLGFRYDGTFPQHMIVKGRNRDTAWYSMIDREWPRIRNAFEWWLRPENFDANGKQRHSINLAMSEFED